MWHTANCWSCEGCARDFHRKHQEPTTRHEPTWNIFSHAQESTWCNRPECQERLQKRDAAEVVCSMSDVPDGRMRRKVAKLMRKAES